MIKQWMLAILLIVSIAVSAQIPRLVIPAGHSRPITMSEMSGDRKFILTASQDQTAKLWDASTGLLLYTFAENPGQVIAANFSKSGKFVLLIAGQQFQVYNINRGVKLVLTGFYNTTLLGAKFYNNEKEVIVVAKNGNCDVWDINSAHRLNTIAGFGTINGFDVSGPGEYILRYGGHDLYTVKIYSGEIKSVLHFKKLLSAACLAPDGISFATYESSKIKIWKSADGNLLDSLNTPFMQPWESSKSLAYSKDGNYLLNVCNGSIYKWNRWDKTRTKMEKSVWDISSAKFSESGAYILGFSIRAGTNKLYIWDAQAGLLSDSIPEQPYIILSASFDKNDKVCLVPIGNRLLIWDLERKQLELMLAGYTISAFDTKISSDDSYLLSLSRFGAKLWDLRSNRFITNLGDKRISSAQFSHDGRRIVYTCQSDSVFIYDIRSRKTDIMTSLPGQVKYAEFSPDDKTIASCSDTSLILLWDIKTSTVKKRLQSAFRSLKKVFFSENGKCLSALSKTDSAELWIRRDVTQDVFDKIDTEILASYGVFSHSETLFLFAKHSRFGVFDLVKKNLVFSTEDTSENEKFRDLGLEHVVTSVYSLSFSRDDKTIVIGTAVNHAQIRSPESGQVIYNLSHGNYVCDARFSKSRDRIITASGDHTAKIWTADGKLIKTLSHHSSAVNSAMFSGDNEFIITSDNEGRINKFDAATGRLICTFIAVEKDDYIVISPSGYFRGTTGASRILHYCDDEWNPVLFSQLDAIYNRPDLILKLAVKPDKLLVSKLQKVYEKRMQIVNAPSNLKLQFKQMPKVVIENRAAYEGQHILDRTIALKIKGSDSKSPLTTLKIWINGVPVFGSGGSSIEGGNTTVEKLIKLELSDGENIVEASVLNALGIESLRTNLRIVYHAK